MSSSKAFKTCVSVLALSAFAACATVPTDASRADAQSAEKQFPKPTPEVVAQIKKAPPLDQASFWNKHYHLHPGDEEISLAYIDALMAINSFEEAAEVTKLASVSFPDNPRVFMSLGKALAKQDKALEAVRAYGRVVELSPYDAAPLAAMGAIFDSREDHETAQLAYHRALALDPDRPATLSNLGMSLTLVGKLEQAEEALSRAVELPGATPRIRQNYALILGLLGKFDQAREVAAIDAPEGIAEKNTDFLKGMIGGNTKIQAVAQAAATAPKASATASSPKPEAPEAAPTKTVVSTALAENLVQSVNPDRMPEDETTAASTQIASAKTNTDGKRKLRLRSRGTPPTGGE